MSDQGEAAAAWDQQSLSGLVVTPAWYGLRQQVKHLAQFGGSVQVVHGPRGAGKTAFLQFLREDDDWEVVAVDALRQPSFAQLLHALLAALVRPLPQETSVGELIAELRRYVQQLEKDQLRVVAAVDNADQLDDGSLAALVSVLQGHQDAGFGLHLLFLSKPGLAERIDRLQLLDVSVSDVALPNFSPSELQTLLQEASKQKKLPKAVPVEQAQRIWLQANGLPGPALQIALHSQRAGKEETQTKSAWPLSHIAALAILLLVLIWAILVRDRDDAPQNGANTEVDRQVQRLALPAEPSMPIPASNEVIEPDPGSDMSGANESLDQGESSVVTGIRPNSAGVEAPFERAPESPSTGEVSTDVGDAMSPQAAPETELGANLDNRSSGSASGDPTVEGDEASTPASVGEALANTSSTVQRQNAGTAAQDAVTDTGEAVVNAKRLAGLTSDEAALMKLPASGYVLQLMAIVGHQKLADFVTEQPNRASLKMYRALRNGRELYILVEGHYDSREAAQAAIANLPSSQRRAGPWAKATVEIHQEIERMSRL